MNELNYINWEDFFKDIPFTLFRTSLIQEKYISTINRYATKLVSEKENVDLLEIAGGSGYTSVVIADLLRNTCVNVSFSDISDQIVKSVKDKFEGFKNLKFMVLDSFNLQEKIYADIIFHQGFLEHFSDIDIISLLKEQGEVAKYIIFDIPNSRRWNKYQEFGNERFLSVSEWKALINKSGLTIYEYQGRRFKNSWKKYVPNIMLNSIWFGKYFGESTTIVCGK